MRLSLVRDDATVLGWNIYWRTGSGPWQMAGNMDDYALYADTTYDVVFTWVDPTRPRKDVAATGHLTWRKFSCS